MPDNTEAKTENVYAGGAASDGRQGDATTKPSRFRPVYRNLTPEEKKLHDDIKAKAVELETLIESVGAGRYTSMALTALEESVIWSVKQLTS